MRSPDFSASNAIVFPSATSRAVFGRRSTFPVLACDVIALASSALLRVVAVFSSSFFSSMIYGGVLTCRARLVWWKRLRESPVCRRRACNGQSFLIHLEHRQRSGPRWS